MIGSATAEALLASANDAYMQLHNERNELESERNEYRYVYLY